MSDVQVIAQVAFGPDPAVRTIDHRSDRIYDGLIAYMSLIRIPQ